MSTDPPTAVTTYVYPAAGWAPAPPGSVTTFVYDPADPPRPLSTWYTTFDADGRIVHSGPAPMTEPPQAPEDPPDEPHIVG